MVETLVEENEIIGMRLTSGIVAECPNMRSEIDLIMF